MLGAELLHLGAQGGDGGPDDGSRIGSDRIAVGIVRWNLVLPVVGHAEAGMEYGQGGEAGACDGGAVIALLDRDELRLLRSPARVL